MVLPRRTETEYRAKVAEVRHQLDDLPSEDKVILFDHHRRVVKSMAENLDKATEGLRADLVRLLMEHATARNRALGTVECTASVRPFFEVSGRPRTDSNPQYQRSALDWYLEVG